MMSSARIRAFALGLALCGSAALAPAPANAGFFDQLFGGSAPEPSQPSYGSQIAPEPMSPDGALPAPPSHPRKKLVLRDPAPVRQKTTDLWHDKTLRVGDAIMMKDGVHIYNGPEAIKHSAREFVRIDSARSVSASAKAALVAIDTTRFDPLRKPLGPDTLASGRSAAVGVPISKGFKITDARGASIRYVGP